MDDYNKKNDASTTVESTDRGLFDFMKKKEGSDEHKTSETEVISGVEKMHVSEPKYEEKKHGRFLEKLRRSDSSSSSSSDEEGDDEEKKKKRREKKEKKAGLKEKIGVHKEDHHHEDTAVPIEKVHVQEHVYSEPSYPAPPLSHHQDHHQEAEEKKGGFLDKIKEKLPGNNGKVEDHTGSAPPVHATTEPCGEGDKEKKGFLDKIKDKIPGFHSKSDSHEEKKDHD